MLLLDIFTNAYYDNFVIWTYYVYMDFTSIYNKFENVFCQKINQLNYRRARL